MINFKKIIFITISTLGVLAVVLFFIWPRIPEIIISQPYFLGIPNTIQNIIIIYVNITVISTNYIDYKINTLNIDSKIINFNLTGNGMLNNQYIKARDTSKLIIPILFDNLNNISNISNIGNVCSAKERINIVYTIKVYLNVISTFYIPTIDGSNSFICDSNFKETSRI